MPSPELAVLDAAVALGRALRKRGVAADVDGELALCRALAELDLRRREHVYWAARSCLVRDRDSIAVFDELFARFWAGLSLGVAGARPAEHGESDPRLEGPQHGGESLPQFRAQTQAQSLLGQGAGHASRALDRLPTASGQELRGGRRQGVFAAYSPDEALSERERPDYASDELAAVRRLAEELRAHAPERRSRRVRAGRRGRLDLRGTVRASLRTDGELLHVRRAGPVRKPRRLLLLCDVSGSMERYSRALLASLQAAVEAGIEAEAFVFATRLTRLTGPLAGRDAAAALGRARGAVPDWSGGTRIGRSLEEFDRRWGRLGLARGAIVLIVSDGWDRGDPELLARELARLRLQCRRLVWINPRPDDLNGQPLALGMRVALDHVDDVVHGHDPRATAALARLIGGLGSGRPARPSRPLTLAVR